MSDTDEISESILSLLSQIDIIKVSDAVCNIVKKISGSSRVALFFWDEDLEVLTNPYVSGDKSEHFIEQFVKAFESEQNPLYKLNEDDSAVAVPELWQPLYCYEISENNNLRACLLFSNKSGKEEKELLAQLRTYPFSFVLSRSWEFHELQQENQRLRNNYEDMEDKTRMLEEQTRKLIQDLTMRDAIRTKHVERERLIYSISNVVRSYVDIQKVLETTVEKIGSTFAVSRCLLIRDAEHLAGFDQLIQVFEYTNDASSVKEMFNTPSGIEFAHAAFSLMRTEDLTEPFVNLNHNINRDFLLKLDFRSGLIVPLMLRDYSLGVLFLQDCSQSRQWSIDDISLIGSLADQVSVAIENAELHLEQERQAITDGLTGIANRRSFNRTINREFERARRYEQPLSLIVLDLDYLKVVNDNFGHQTGDEAIKAIGLVLRQSSRAIDLAARYGGEEFCLLLPNTELAMAEQLAERLRTLINDIHIEGPGHISASIGIASYPSHANDPETLFRRADAALYEAKQSGRNRVKVANAL